MMCNSTNPSTTPDHENVASELLEFKLTQLVRSIPTSERNELFKMCSEMITSRREESRTPKKIK
jgi:hypothetical protein